MASFPIWSVISQRKDTTGQQHWSEWRIDAVSTGGTVAEAGNIILLGADGRIDLSLLPALPFGEIATGTNTTAIMTVSGTAAIQYSDTGVVNANEVGSINVTVNVPTHEGQLLISQPGNTSAAWADPQVQGLYPDGSSIASPPAYVLPTTIQPVYVSGQGTDGNLHGVKVANDGTVQVAVSNFLSISVNVGNSSTATLAAGAAFTGSVVDCTAFPVSSLAVESYSDVASAAAGLAIQWSTDGTSFDRYTAVTATAGLAARINVGIRARYFRIVYTNGSSPQTVFRLQTLTCPTPGTPVFKTVDTTIQGTDTAQAVKAVSIARNPQGIYLPQASDVYGNLGVYFTGGAADAFGRARVSSPQTLFNTSFEYDLQPLLMQTITSGTGTVTKTTNASSATLSTGGTASGARADLLSKGYYRYEPGKSLLIMMTGIIGAANSNVRSQIGFFGNNNGVFFDQNNGIGVTVRTNTSGSPVDTTVLQASWNVDKMDGTGPSGLTLDFSKAQIFLIDLQWLGVGTIRFGFEINGQLYICHEVNNANTNTASVPYMNTAALPVHWAVRNIGTAVSATSITAVCCAVVSEGGADRPQAYEFAASTSVTNLLSMGTTRTPIMAIRPKTTFNGLTNRSRIQISTLAVLDSGAQPLFWELVYNPTLTGASFTDVNTAYSGVQVDTSSTALSGGITIASGYVQGGQRANSSVDLSRLKVPLTLDATGTVPDIFCIVGTAPGNTNVAATVAWTEER